MNRISDTHARLTIEWGSFQDAWTECHASWKDQVAARFEKQFIAPMDAEIPRFLEALDSLSEEIEKASRAIRSD